MHQQKLEYIPHSSDLERNDSPQRSCTSLALGLPTSRGGWQGPGGTAGVWTCRVSDSLQGKTTHQLRREKKQIDNLTPLLSFSLSHTTQTLDTLSLSPAYQTDSGYNRKKGDKCKCIIQRYTSIEKYRQS